MNKKTLILFTVFFPFERLEEYLDNEINYLTKAFDKIFIFSQTPVKNISYELPGHVVSFNNSFRIRFSSKISALFFIDLKTFNEEKKFVNKTLNARFSIMKKKIFLIEYLKSKLFSKPVSKIIEREISDGNSVFLYSYWNDYTAISAALLKKKFPQIKAISRAHGWDVYLERNTENYLPLKKFISDNLDGIYFVSENGRQYFQERFNANKNLKLARLGVNNNNPFKKIIKSKELHLVSCSKIIPLKRIELIIDALVLMADNTSISWIHFGDGPLYEDLKDYAKLKLGDKKNIQFKMPGYIPNTDIFNHYKKGATNVLINVSSTEGLPLTMIEAMSFGIPVIGTDVGGVSEIIQHKANGLLLQENSTSFDIANAIEYFYLMEESEYYRYYENAYKTWHDKFNAEKNYPEFINDFCKL